MKRRAFNNKRDAVEVGIVSALEKAGAKVWRLDQPFDLLCNVGEVLFLIECKSGRAGLNENQIKLAKEWPVLIIRTPEEAIQFVNIIRRLST